jgi:hypothetical protein
MDVLYFLKDGEREADLFQENDELSPFMSPSLHVSRDKLMKAFEQVECLCQWLEEKLSETKCRTNRSRYTIQIVRRR